MNHSPVTTKPMLWVCPVCGHEIDKELYESCPCDMSCLVCKKVKYRLFDPRYQYEIIKRGTPQQPPKGKQR